MIFDIDEFIRMYSGGRIDIYYDKIVNAEDKDLKLFRKAVILHKKGPQTINFAAEVTPQGIKHFSPHEELLKVIDWQFTKRSKISIFFFKKTYPIRMRWLEFWKGADCTINEDYFGIICVGKKRRRHSIEYYGLRQCLISLMKIIWPYIVEHHRWIIGSIIAAIIGLAKLL